MLGKTGSGEEEKEKKKKEEKKKRRRREVQEIMYGDYDTCKDASLETLVLEILV